MNLFQEISQNGWGRNLKNESMRIRQIFWWQKLNRNVNFVRCDNGSVVVQKIFSYLRSNIIMYLWVKYHNTKMNFKGGGGETSKFNKKLAIVKSRWCSVYNFLHFQYVWIFRNKNRHLPPKKLSTLVMPEQVAGCWDHEAQACVVLHLPTFTYLQERGSNWTKDLL